MSKDASVCKDLIQTLEDGREGFAQGADKLEKDGATDVAAVFRRYSTQRAEFSDELQKLAAEYGEQIEESGTVAAAVHRGWMKLKDALAGDDPKGVLDAAEQGEDHAVKEFKKALEADISPEFKAVVQRQFDGVKAGHDEVKALRDQHS